MVWCEADSRDAHNFIRKYGFEFLKARVLAPQSADQKSPDDLLPSVGIAVAS